MTKNKAETKKKAPKKEEEVKIVKEEPKKEKPKKDEGVTLVKNETKPIEPKNVRVVLSRDHKCHIGGNWYTFTSGKQYNVPENVKSVLMKAGLLSAL